MSSYFVNSTFPVSLPGGQDSLLGQIPLYSSGYTDPLRHYSSAATYGAANMQDKVYPASYYQQTGTAAALYGRAGGAACDYNPVGTFYKDAEGSCAFSSRDDQPLFVSQEQQQRKAECAEQSVSMSSSIDDKASTLIYPWMQRMNACSAGESEPLLCCCHARVRQRRAGCQLRSPSQQFTHFGDTSTIRRAQLWFGLNGSRADLRAPFYFYFVFGHIISGATRPARAHTQWACISFSLHSPGHIEFFHILSRNTSMKQEKCNSRTLIIKKKKHQRSSV